MRWLSRSRSPLLGLGLALSVPAAAQAQTCPPAVGYDSTTQPVLGSTPLEIDCVDVTDPRCAATGIVEPSGQVALKEQLFLWLPGRKGRSIDNLHMANIVGFAGYRALFLAWDNVVAVGEACGAATGTIGGSCSDDCSGTVREELLTGRDDPTDATYTPQQLDGIVHRVAMALEQEHEADVNGVWQWDQYCAPDPVDGTKIDWAHVVVGGHSFGGNQAAYISYRHPTSGALVVDSGHDACDALLPDPMNLQVDVYEDTGSDYNLSPDGDAALWVKGTGPDGDQSPGSRVFFLHEQDIFPGVVWPELPASFDYLTPGALDVYGQPLAASHYEVDVASGGWSGQPIVSTFQEPATACPNGPETLPEHASMAADNCMPPSAAGGATVHPVFGDSSTLHLFDTYVDALCSF